MTLSNSSCIFYALLSASCNRKMRNLIYLSRPSSNRVHALTGLRIFAALAIVLLHLEGQLWLPAGGFAGVQLNQGVGFFYVLSGFILQHSYRQRLGVERGITTAQFVALRFFRLWPCHVAVIGLLIAASGKSTLDYYLLTYSSEQLFAAIFLLQAWHPDLKVVFAINGPAWSISVEMFFYAMFPLLCRETFKSPLGPMCIGAAITIAWLTTIWLYMPTGNFETLAGTNPLARIFEFSVGISTYEFFSRSKRHFWSGTLSELGALALAVISVATTPTVAYLVGAKLGLHLAWWLGNCASFWTFAILIGVFFSQKGSVSRLVASKPIAYLGEISFALYLVHQPVILYLARSAPWFHQQPLPMQVVLFTAIVLGLSAGLHHLVEKPCMNVAKHLILRPRLQMALSA